jgi:hypothetical protein
MIIGIKVHTKDKGIQVADAPEDCNCGDFLVEILKVVHPGSPRQEWALEDAVTSKTLQTNLTLSQNQVGNHHELNLVSTRRVKAHDLELEIVAPNGKELQCEAPSSTNAGRFLADLVKHFDLPPGKWILVHGKNGEALDPNESLSSNGVNANDRLAVQQVVEDAVVALEVTSSSGSIHRATIHPDALTSKLVDDLVDLWKLPKNSAAGVPIQWLIYHAGTGKVVDSAKTVAQNGLVTDDRLTLRQGKVADLTVSVSISTGDSARVEVAADKQTQEFIQDQVENFRLEKLNKRGRPNLWLMVNARSQTRLDPKKSLAGNGVVTGDPLQLGLDLSDLKLQVIAPGGAVARTEEPADTLVEELLRDLVASFGLQSVSEKGKPVHWHLYGKDAGRPLDPKKSLALNGVVDGDRLVMKQKAELGDWFRSNAKVAAIVLLSLFGIAAAAAIIHALANRKHTVEVSPKVATLSAAERVAFHGQVSGHGDGKVLWTSEPAIGSIDADGVYSAPSSVLAQQLVKVTATSAADATVSDSAVITLQPAAIRLSPDNASLAPSEFKQFQATLRSDAGPNAQWSLDPKEGTGTITQQGLYTAPAFIAATRNVTVIVTSLKFPQFAARATITLNAGPAIRMRPSAVSLSASGTQSFRLDPNPTGTLQWHITPKIGSITANGVYTAPGVVLQPSQVRVTAALGPASGSADAATLLPNVSAIVNLRPVAVGPISCVLRPSRQYQCATSVANTANPAVNWSISPPSGSISAQGLYTPPKNHPAQSVMVTATSLADHSKTSTFTLQLSPTEEVRINLNSYQTELHPGESEQLSVSVAGSDDKAATWSLAGLGRISPFGMYQAPQAVPVGGATVRITATSNADPNKSAVAIISLRAAPRYSGPPLGAITWKGKLNKRETLSIQNNTPNVGRISGMLPGVPVDVQVLTKDCMITMNPSQQNGWKSISVETTSKQKTIVIEWRVRK